MVLILFSGTSISWVLMNPRFPWIRLLVRTSSVVKRAISGPQIVRKPMNTIISRTCGTRTIQCTFPCVTTSSSLCKFSMVFMRATLSAVYIEDSDSMAHIL